MIQQLRDKATAFTAAVTSDPRWDLQDELLIQIFGFTLYGYAVGVGRLSCFLDVPDIQTVAREQLTGLGVGPQYSQGLVENAHNAFLDESGESVYTQLVGIGHSHWAADSLDQAVESVFVNTQKLRQ